MNISPARCRMRTELGILEGELTAAAGTIPASTAAPASIAAPAAAAPAPVTVPTPEPERRARCVSSARRDPYGGRLANSRLYRDQLPKHLSIPRFEYREKRA